tara:strand:+ start:183 stop:2033 length:1851 start_codon:yes stop_codon:yes gene_type:complete
MLLSSLYPIKSAIQKSILLLTLILFSCSKGQDGLIEPISPEITSFAFLMEFNPTLEQDLDLIFDGVNTFSGSFDYLCDVENLVASYDFVGDTVSVNDEVQTKFVTSNDFTETVEYIVTTQDGSSSKNYFIEISFVTEDTIEMKSFSFLAELNPTLTQDVHLTFDGVDTFSAAVNELCAIENLVASYTFIGGNVLVNSNVQVTGESSNNFNKPVVYVASNVENSATKSFYVEISYFTGLPRILINTNNTPINSKDDYVDGFVTVKGGLGFEDIAMQEMKIRGRGNSTWGHPKKPYQLKADSKSPMLNMLEDKKWLFLAEYSDKSLIRNKISLDLGAMSRLEYTPKGEYAEVFLNDEYNGTYLITQKVEVKSNRLNLPDNGYLVEIDQDYRLDADDIFFKPTIFTQKHNENVFNIKEPSVDYNTAAFDLIKDYINNFEAALFGANFKDAQTGYQAYIDLPSFIDWYLVQEIAKSVDAKYYSSIYFNYIPGPGGKIKMGPLWDFDLSYGNVDYANSQYTNGFWIKENPWYKRLFEDPAFESEVKERFMYFYNNTNVILDKIDEYAKQLERAQGKNYEKWPTLGTYVWPNPVYFDTHAEEVSHLKDWVTKRMEWLHGEFN